MYIIFVLFCFSNNIDENNYWISAMEERSLKNFEMLLKAFIMYGSGDSKICLK